MVIIIGNGGPSDRRAFEMQTLKWNRDDAATDAALSTVAVSIAAGVRGKNKQFRWSYN